MYPGLNLSPWNPGALANTSPLIPLWFPCTILTFHLYWDVLDSLFLRGFAEGFNPLLVGSDSLVGESLEAGDPCELWRSTDHNKEDL